jgi:hypothetical protein
MFAIHATKVSTIPKHIGIIDAFTQESALMFAIYAKFPFPSGAI